MAYDFFTQPQGPQIDVDLFPRAALQGAQRQQITGTPFSNAVEGVVSGLKTGVGLVSAAQDIYSQSIQDDLNKERLEQQKMQTQTMSLEQQVLLNNQDAVMLTKENQLKQAKIESENKLKDAKNEGLITDVIVSGTPQEKAGLLLDPSVNETLFRKPELAQKVIGNLEASGVDPALIKKARATYDAVALQQQRAKFAATEELANQQIAKSGYEKYVPAKGYLQANSNAFVEATKRPDFNASNLNLYKKGEVSVENGRIKVDPSTKKPQLNDVAAGTAQGYVLTYGDQVLDSNIPESQGTEMGKQLSAYKTYLAADFPRIAGTVPSAPKEQPKQQAQQQQQSSNAQLPADAATKAADVNDNIIAAAKARNEQFAKRANQSGVSSYNDMISKGAQLSRNRAVANAPAFSNSSQSTPQVPNAPKITRATPPAGGGSLEAGLNHISNVIGTRVVPDFSAEKLGINDKTVQKVSGIPALKDQPALFKGLVAIESGADVNAASSKGAAGYMQLMPAAAQDVGLTSEERYDPVKNIQGGIKYYQNVESALTKAMGQQGLPRKVDPRMTLAAYNGGPKWIINGIQAGATTWDEMKDYLKANKNAEAYKENVSYPDKVIAASFPFVQGGNASDDAYLQALISFGILEV